MDKFNTGEGTEEGGQLENFIKNTLQFYQVFNEYNPKQFEIDNGNRIGMSAIFLLSKIADSLESIQNSLMREDKISKF